MNASHVRALPLLLWKVVYSLSVAEVGFLIVCVGRRLVERLVASVRCACTFRRPEQQLLRLGQVTF